jgi:ABC-type uncharacterized transport system permease subunit
MEGLAFASVLLASTLRIAVPYLFAALGGFHSERSGVINIGLEGMLLIGAFACVLVAHAAEAAGVAGGAAAWLGVGGAAAAGAGLGALHALVCVRFGADQIVSGLGVNLLAAGTTKFLLTVVYGTAANSSRIAGIDTWRIPGLADWDVTRVLFCTPLVLLGLAAAIFSQLVSRRTVFGLRLHAVGEHPEAARTLGVRVARLRWAGVILSGALAGLGGAWLALEQHQFTAGMSSGRGFIALAALIFGKWTPRGAAVACVLFGCAEAVQIQLQGREWGVPSQFLQMLPYLVTMVALAGIVGRSRPPAALGRPLEAESRL